MSRAFWRAAAIVSTVVGLSAILVVVAVLAFSVRVHGHSMDPTLAEGDRLVADPFGRDEVARFDLVEAQTSDGQRIVKRVIGLPGDTVRIDVTDGVPTVSVTPAGESGARVVENSAWPSRIGDKTQNCCRDDGRSARAAAPQGDGALVPEGSYWLLGDNWGGSDDSRTFGFFAQEAILATFDWRLWPGPGRVDVPARFAPLS